jgi:hypothetical protein
VRDERLVLHWWFCPEVGSAVLAFGPMQASKADTDAGDSLLETTRPPAAWRPLLRGTNRFQPQQLTLTLLTPPRPAGTIKLLQGVLPVEAAADLETMVEIPDLAKAARTTVAGTGTVALEVGEVQQEGAYRTARVLLRGHKENYDSNSRRWEAFDAQGRRMVIYPYPPNFSRTPDGWAGVVSVQAPAGAAVRLRLSSFRRVRTHLSFTLKDVPLP